MKRSLRSTLCLMAAATLAGGLLYLAKPASKVSLPVAVQSIAEPVIEQLNETMAPVQSAAASVAGTVANWVSDAPVQQPGVPVVLLKEPVIILGEQREALPKGTPVRVLQHHGFYVQVQHESRIVTIPRTAMVLGAYRPN